MSETLSRRSLLYGLGGLALLPGLTGLAHGAPTAIRTRPIPKTGEHIPIVGMGTWITFNVGSGEALRQKRLMVLKRFFELGGGMVDSSPMYGSAEDVMGWCLQRLGNTDGLFSATKIWSPAGGSAEDQMRNSEKLWALPKLDLQQVHNLVNWEDHLAVLNTAKANGRIRYIGITTSHGRRHREMAKIMSNKDLDFVQFTYNIFDREAEDTLLPLAQERGIAVIINRPFQRGSLFDYVEGKPLPNWADDIDCDNWAQFFLKFILSHPGVTVAIPATSQVSHMEENMAAMHGRMPDPDQRRAMIKYVRDL